MARHITANETAKLVRETLKVEFPGIKFSVTKRGFSLDVKWVDGPTTKQVDKVIGMFEGASFDGMIDLKSYNTVHTEGEDIHYGIDYILTKRSYSREFLQHMIDYVNANNLNWTDGDPQMSVTSYTWTHGKKTITEYEVDAVNKSARFGNQFWNDIMWRACSIYAGNALPEIKFGEFRWY